MSEEKDKEKTIEEFEAEINDKLAQYFSENKNIIISKDNLEDFLKAIGFEEFLSSEDDKNMVWEKLAKYGKENKVDSEGVKKGMYDFFNFLRKGDEEDLSRISLKNEEFNANEKQLIIHKEKAIEEYDCLDIKTLIEFKRIFLLLNLDENGENIISIEQIEQLIADHKFITIDKDDIIKYIYFLSCDDKLLDEITSIKINNTIYAEVDSLIQNKFSEEGINIDQIISKKGQKEEDEDPVDILNDILKEIVDTETIFAKIENDQNNLIKSKPNLTEEKIKNIIDNINENKNIEEISNIIQSLRYVITKIENNNKYLSEINNQQNSNIKDKINSLKKITYSLNEELFQTKKDYDNLNEEYEKLIKQNTENNNHIQNLYENRKILEEELNSKEQKINDLTKEKSEKDKEINDLNIKISSLEDNNKELKNQVIDLKMSVSKIKKDYDELIDDTINKMKEKDNEIKRIKGINENQLKKKENKEGILDKKEKLDLAALNKIDSLKISLADKLIEKEKILSKSNFESLKEYTLKLERININLKEEKEKKEQKLKELEEKVNESNEIITSNKKEIGELNIEIKKLENSITNLQDKIKAKEVLRPALTINNKIKELSISKFNPQRLNSLKFKKYLKDNDKSNNAKNEIIKEKNNKEKEAELKIKITSSETKLNNNNVNSINKNNLEISKNSMSNKPGLESPSKINKSYYENKVCILILYEISSRKSFETAKRLFEDFKNSDQKEVSMALVGNKSDSEKKREITEEEGQKFAVKNGMQFFETSAKIGENIEEVFKKSDVIISKKKKENYCKVKNISFGFEKTILKGNKEGGCCKCV